MTPHICENCGATVGDEQFCPTCGEWVDPLRPEAEQEFEAFSLSEEPPAGEEPQQIRRESQTYSEEIPCPSCGTRNPVSNRHCENCGARLAQGALPVAPRPAVQTTAGVRAALGIAGILLLVILAVTVVGLLNGDEEPAASATTTTATTAATRPDPEPLTVLSVDCSVDGIPGFPCGGLIDDQTQEYQFNWDELAPDTEVSITFTFAQAVEISGLIWENIPVEEEDRFTQNYKVQRISVVDDSGTVEIPLSIPNQPGSIPLNYVSLRTNTLTIKILAVHPAEDVDGQQFSDLAIRGIQILGNPVNTAPADPGATTGDTTGGTTGDTAGPTTTAG